MSKVSREAILRRDSYSCVYCGASPRDTKGVVLHLDHVVPVIYGGSNTAANVVTACGPCNRGKSVSIEESAYILPIVAIRNKDNSIHPDSIVSTVREKNDPRKIVSIRLSEEEESYCLLHGSGSLGGFVRSLIEYHKEEAQRRADEAIRFEAYAEAHKGSIEAQVYQKKQEEIDRLKASVGSLKQINNNLAQAHPKTTPTKPKPKPAIPDYDYETQVRDLTDL